MKHASVMSWGLVFAVAGCGAGVDGSAPAERTETSAASVNASPEVQIAPRGWRPYGRSYGEWEAAWWQWNLRIPSDRNPVTDTTGEHCAEGQSGNVWFLAGNYGGETHRECTVPAGKALYFPVANQIWVQMLTDNQSNTVAWMYDEVRNAVRHAELSVTIDGLRVVGLPRYYEETPVFPVTFGPDNTWGVTAENCPLTADGMFQCDTSVDAGYALFIYPLPEGDHDIHFTAAYQNGFSLDVTYRLHVR